MNCNFYHSYLWALHEVSSYFCQYFDVSCMESHFKGGPTDLDTKILQKY